MKKVLFCFILITIVLNVFNFKVYGISWSEMERQMKEFQSAGNEKLSDFSTGAITEPFRDIGQILTVVGAGVMIMVTTYMGIKYITASPEGQAKLKQQLIGVVVSGIVIFGAYGIWRLAIDIFEEF